MVKKQQVRTASRISMPKRCLEVANSKIANRK
jgi:hypothetical protein